MKLLRVETTWDQLPTDCYEGIFKIYGGVTKVRRNRNDASIGCFEISEITEEEMRGKFTHYLTLGSRCRMINFVYEAEEVGKLPFSYLKANGFKLSELGIWIYPHTDISLSAIPVKYKVKEWILSFQKREGVGVPLTIFNNLPEVSRQQMILDLNGRSETS